VGAPIFREFLPSLKNNQIDDAHVDFTGMPLKKIFPFESCKFCEACKQRSLHVRKDFMKLTRFYINESIQRQPELIDEASRNIFILLKDVYRLVASEWMLVYELWDRRLKRIETKLWLQNRIPLSVYKGLLTELYQMQSKLSVNLELIKEASRQCGHDHLKALSSTFEVSTIAKSIGKDLEDDYEFVIHHFDNIATRMGRDADEIANIINIRSAEHSASLNGLVLVVGPLGLCISFLSLPTPWGAGGQRVISFTAPLLASIAAFFLIGWLTWDPTWLFCRSRFLSLQASWRQWVQRRRLEEEWKSKERKSLEEPFAHV
jgi:hypothetical protein